MKLRNRQAKPKNNEQEPIGQKIRLSGENPISEFLLERFYCDVVRERVMRTLEKGDTPILADMQIYHNYIRPHEALEGKTPAELAGIEIKGENRWLTLIQNASCK